MDKGGEMQGQDIVKNKVCPVCLGAKKVLLSESEKAGTKLYELCKNCLGAGTTDPDVVHLSESAIYESHSHTNRLTD